MAVAEIALGMELPAMAPAIRRVKAETRIMSFMV
jgi:hypothetical protein